MDDLRQYCRTRSFIVVTAIERSHVSDCRLWYHVGSWEYGFRMFSLTCHTVALIVLTRTTVFCHDRWTMASNSIIKNTRGHTCFRAHVHEPLNIQKHFASTGVSPAIPHLLTHMHKHFQCSIVGRRLRHVNCGAHGR